jgi:hypothetical protein
MCHAVPHNRVDPPRIAGRVACAYKIKDIVESREQTISSEPTTVPHQPFAFELALTGAQSWGRSRRPSGPRGRICVRCAGDAEDAERVRVSGL